MRFTRSDIVEDVLAHIRELGGDFSEWCVGTARDREGEFFRRHGASRATGFQPVLEHGQDAHGTCGDGLIWREAYTSYAAADVAERLADCGLRPDRAWRGEASGRGYPQTSVSSHHSEPRSRRVILRARVFGRRTCICVSSSTPKQKAGRPPKLRAARTCLSPRSQSEMQVLRPKNRAQDDEICKWFWQVCKWFWQVCQWFCHPRRVARTSHFMSVILGLRPAKLHENPSAVR